MNEHEQYGFLFAVHIVSFEKVNWVSWVNGKMFLVNGANALDIVQPKSNIKPPHLFI